MTTDEHKLTVVGEECVEVVMEMMLALLRMNMRVSKSLRFGTDEVQPGRLFSNGDRVMYEFCDLVASVEACQEAGILPVLDPKVVEGMKAEKRQKVLNFLKFSGSLGRVEGVAADPTVPHPEAAVDRPGRPPRKDYSDRKGDWIQLASGGRFYPLDPRKEDVNLQDLAVALARLPRFGGHVSGGPSVHYSVAQHSIIVSEIVSPEAALIGLMHDAHEALSGLGDVTRPVKNALLAVLPFGEIVPWSHVEQLIQAQILAALCPPMDAVTYSGHEAEVKWADRLMLVTEAREFMTPVDDDWWHQEKYGSPSLDRKIELMSPRAAAERFVERFGELTAGRQADTTSWTSPKVSVSCPICKSWVQALGSIRDGFSYIRHNPDAGGPWCPASERSVPVAAREFHLAGQLPWGK